MRRKDMIETFLSVRSQSIAYVGVRCSGTSINLRVNSQPTAFHVSTADSSGISLHFNRWLDPKGLTAKQLREDMIERFWHSLNAAQESAPSTDRPFML